MNFTLPRNPIACTETPWRLEACGGFDPAQEVFHCDKPGTGLAELRLASGWEATATGRVLRLVGKSVRLVACTSTVVLP